MKYQMFIAYYISFRIISHEKKIHLDVEIIFNT